MSGPCVTILLVTYDGARYLDSQLESIYRQDWPNWRIFARDDGSTDTTKAILDRWAKIIQLTVKRGPHLGAKASFLELLYGCGADSEMTAFADQDDVWHRDKITRAVKALAALPPKEPAMYCSRAQIVDAKLRVLGMTRDWPRPPSFANALVENCAMGCTTVLNEAAVRLLTSAPPPAHACMHDWWCYLVVAAFGTVIFDPRPSLCYRQHALSSIGAQARAWERLVSKVAHLIQSYSVDPLFDQALDLQSRYGARMRSQVRRQLEDFLVFRSTQFEPGALLSQAFHRQDRLDDLVLRLLFALPAIRRRRSVGPAM